MNDVNRVEICAWFQQVQAEFDELIAPSLEDFNIAYDGKTIVALLFETDRFPFIIKATNERLEIPWREGTRIRSAKRSDLLKLLIPLRFVPDLEILSGEANINRNNAGEIYWVVSLVLYIEPQGDTCLVIPLHKCEAQLQIVDSRGATRLERLRLYTPAYAFDKPYSRTSESTQDELLVYGPGKVNFAVEARLPQLPEKLDCDIRVDLKLLSVGAEYPAVVNVNLAKSPEPPKDSYTLHTWRLRN